MIKLWRPVRVDMADRFRTPQLVATVLYVVSHLPDEQALRYTINHVRHREGRPRDKGEQWHGRCSHGC